MRPPEIDLATCLARVARRDDAAARELVVHCHPTVLRLVRAHHARGVDEDDLLQEVYARLFAKVEGYQPRDGVPFEHWLSRLTVNACRDVLRSETRRADALPLSSGASEELDALVAPGAPGAHGDGPRAPGDDAAARELVDALLAQLPSDDALVLTLLDLEQRSTAEIAQLTGWSRALVKVRAFRARGRLRAVARRMQRGRDG